MEHNRVKNLEKNSGERDQETPTEKIINVVQFRQEITKLGIIDIQIKGLQSRKGTINKQVWEKLSRKNSREIFLSKQLQEEELKEISNKNE